MDKLKQAGKLALLQEEPNLALFDEIQSVSDKLRGIQGVLKSINNKEVKTYEGELETLQNAILSLTQSVNNKDTVVNIPLDQLSAQLVKVESAIKAIGVFKEMKIPEFPSEMSLNEVQVNELLLAIESIPPFPIKELEKLMNSLAEKLKVEKQDVEEFDYDRLERKFNELVKAVKNVSVTVSSGGGGIGQQANNNLDIIASNTNYSTNLEGDGAVTIGTTAVELTFAGTTKSIILTANQSNTGIIYIGKSTVTNLGANALTFLMPGESLTLDYNDATNALYAVSDTAAQSLFKGSLL